MIEFENMQTDEAQQHKLLCAHIKTALSSPSGVVLFSWLKENCFMSEPMNFEAMESAAFNYRVNARRDLFITLESLLMEGLKHGNSE